MSEKPTLEELEAILNAGQESPIEILPNGEVRALSPQQVGEKVASKAQADVNFREREEQRRAEHKERMPKAVCTKCLRKATKEFVCPRCGEHGHVALMTEEAITNLRDLVSMAWRFGVQTMDGGDGTSPDECDYDEEMCGEEGCETIDLFIERHNPFPEDWKEADS